MSAWVSPERTVRSTPLRISVSSTETRRSWISRTDNSALLEKANENVAAVDLYRVNGNGLGGRQAGGLAGREIETRAMQPAFDRGPVNVPFGQWDLFMRAHVVNSVEVAVGIHDRDRGVTDVDVHGSIGRHLVDRARTLEFAHMPTCASSSSTAAMSRSAISGTPILLITSAKKPRTTSLRAMSAGMPRAIR